MNDAAVIRSSRCSMLRPVFIWEHRRMYCRCHAFGSGLGVSCFLLLFFSNQPGNGASSQTALERRLRNQWKSILVWNLEPVTAEEFCLSPTARVIFARQPSKHRRTVQRFLKIIGLKKVNKLWIYPAISGRNGTAVNCFTAAPLTLMLMIKHCITPKVSALDDKTSSHSQRNGS